MRREHLSTLLETTISATALFYLYRFLQSAFSLDVKMEIWRRANGKSEVSGRDDEPLECAHINHSRWYRNYNKAKNGILMTLTEHLRDHEKRAGRNGLSYEDNEWAIHEIKRRIQAFRNQEALDQYSRENS